MQRQVIIVARAGASNSTKVVSSAKQGMTDDPGPPSSTLLHPLSLYHKRLGIGSVQAPLLPPSCALNLLFSCYTTPSCFATAS